MILKMLKDVLLTKVKISKYFTDNNPKIYIKVVQNDFRDDFANTLYSKVQISKYFTEKYS